KNHFVKLNCAAIPKSLIESEFFGFEKGAFTGAHLKKPGKFELANGGTILLNDIGEVDISIQGKLLQVLQDGKFSRLGGDGDVLIDARIIVTTKNNLERSMMEGLFREDLFYRINVISITVPPLRERKEQILPLTQYFFNFFKEKYRRDAPPLSPKATKIFKEYLWPGNIRELENIVKRMIVTSDEEAVIQMLLGKKENGEIVVESLRPNSIGEPLLNLKEVGRKAGEEAEKDLIHATLHETHWNRKEAAKLLHISYKALLYKIEKYHLNKGRGYQGKGEIAGSTVGPISSGTGGM
ncbi:MAG: sigma 54-interacting transcriptional regulator, partial [Deltaproteobacteria bacterium]|nr:sigma 54-interacting transcriptional regulator [Deltaproteobacteria bacterium]